MDVKPAPPSHCASAAARPLIMTTAASACGRITHSSRFVTRHSARYATGMIRCRLMKGIVMKLAADEPKGDDDEIYIHQQYGKAE